MLSMTDKLGRSELTENVMEQTLGCSWSKDFDRKQNMFAFL